MSDPLLQQSYNGKKHPNRKRPPQTVEPRKLSDMENEALSWLHHWKEAELGSMLLSFKGQVQRWQSEPRHRFDSPLSPKQWGILIDRVRAWAAEEEAVLQLRRTTTLLESMEAIKNPSAN